MRRGLKITFNAPVVLGFAAICLIATAVNYLTEGWANRMIFSTYHSSLRDPLTYVRFFTHVFGHANWSHLFGNLCYLLLLGPLLEEKYGPKVLLSIMALTTVATGLINYIFFWNVALCGASGIVFAFIVLSSFTGFRNGEIPLTFILVALLFIGQQVTQGIFVQDNISNMAHIVGGLVGAVSGYLLNQIRR